MLSCLPFLEPLCNSHMVGHLTRLSTLHGVLQVCYCFFVGMPSPGQPATPKADLDEQTNKYAEVVRSINKALAGGSSQQLDATKAFLAACPEVANGKLP